MPAGVIESARERCQTVVSEGYFCSLILGLFGPAMACATGNNRELPNLLFSGPG